MPPVAIVVGSRSDLPHAEKARETLAKFGVESTLDVASAHRTPEKLDRLIRGSSAEVFIAMAGMSAALPGAVAARTMRPVIGVPLSGGVDLDSLLSIVQMPRGVPVAAVAVNGAENAALLAIEILSLRDPALRERLAHYRESWREEPESPRNAKS